MYDLIAENDYDLKLKSKQDKKKMIDVKKSID